MWLTYQENYALGQQRVQEPNLINGSYGKKLAWIILLKVRHGVDQCKKMRNLHDLNLFNGSS